jgi:hypothetical protein
MAVQIITQGTAAVQLSSKVLLSVKDYMDQQHIHYDIRWSYGMRIKDYHNYDIVLNYRETMKLLSIDISYDLVVDDLHRSTIVEFLNDMNADRFSRFVYFGIGSSRICYKSICHKDDVPMVADDIRDMFDLEIFQYETYASKVSALVGCLEALDVAMKKLTTVP